MKALMLIFHDLDKANGISKKITYQYDALCSNGVETVLCTYVVDNEGNRKRLVGDRVLTNYGNGLTAKLKARFDYRELTAYICREKFDFVYMRSFHNATPFLTAMLARLQQNGIKVVMEIPTYPYDSEYRGFGVVARIGLHIDQLFRRSMARKLFRIVTFSNNQTIFGVKTLRISNGIDFESIPLRHALPFDGQEFHLIGVAEVHYWHGFDRVLEGLGQYYRNPSPHKVKVIFHIVGGIGPTEAARFDPLIDRYQLAPYVVRHGRQDDEALDALFDHAHFGIASLGRHRSGITNIKTLKNREYAARGIGFVYSETDDDFDQAAYVLKAPADESPLNIQRLIDFYQEQPISPEAIRNSVQHLSWKNQMKRVIDQIKNS